ncbi:hypothetical protein QTP70_026926, partial [Hemibagrus guttatus]
MFSRSLLLVLLGLSCLQNFTMAQSASGADLCCFEFHKNPFPAANAVSYTVTRSDCTVPGVIMDFFHTFKLPSSSSCSDQLISPAPRVTSTLLIHHASTRSSSPSAAMFSRSLLLVLLGLSCLQNFTMAQSASGADLCCFEFHKKPFPAANAVSYTVTRSDCTVPGVICKRSRIVLFRVSQKNIPCSECCLLCNNQTRLYTSWGH